MIFSFILTHLPFYNTEDFVNFPFKKVIVGIACAKFLFEEYIAYRQLKLLETPNKCIPPTLKNKIDDKKISESEAYGIATIKFEIISTAYNFVSNLGALVLYPLMWNYSVSIGNAALSFIMKRPFEMSLLASNISFFLTVSIFFSIVKLPRAFYENFVLEEKFGFNNMTKSLFFMDTIKVLLLKNILGSSVLYALGFILEKCTKKFVYTIWIFVFAFQIFLFLLNDLIFIPMFYTLTPLDNKELQDKINALAKQCGFPLSEIYMIDGSKRSSHSNAYFSGLPFMKKKIVIFDTLIKDSSIDEVVAVLGHEIGHWKMNHIPQMLIISQIHISVFFMLFNNVYKNVKMFADFNFIIDPSSKVPTTTSPVSKYVVVNDYPFLVGLFLFMELMKSSDLILDFAIKYYYRHCEYQADNYAVRLGKGKDLKDSLVQLQRSNLSTIYVDKLYSMYHYTHPSISERLEAVDKYNSKQAKKSN
ncbi:hypothetical protein ACO0R3_000261 [Hanseniaspora guilliermondii]